jgi:serine/threonine protein kinase
MKFQKDQKINGFTLCDEIGDGAFSNVFTAVHEKYNYPICIKIQKNDKSSNNAAKNEIEMLRKINKFSDDGIIVLLEDFVITENETELICMVIKKYDYDLHTYRKQVHNGKIPYAIAAKIYKKIAAACKTLHNNGIIHTDIKPDNILINANSTSDNIDVVLSDFGGCEEYVAGAYSSSLGTPEYQAPEIIVGYPYNHSIDIWALGCTFYEMLTGDYLFDPTNHNDDDSDNGTLSSKNANASSVSNSDSNKSDNSINENVEDSDAESWNTVSENESYNTNETDYSNDENSDLMNLIHLYLIDELLGRMPEYIVDEGHYAGHYFDYKSRLFGLLYKNPLTMREFIEEKEELGKFPADFTMAAKNELIGILTNSLKYDINARV